jgi:hypothetical protein
MRSHKDKFDKEEALYWSALFVTFLLIRVFVPKIAAMLPDWVGTLIAMILLAAFGIVVAGVWFLFIWARFDEGARNFRSMIGFGVWSVIPLVLLATVFIAILDVLFGTTVEKLLTPLTPPREIQALIAAVAGLIVLLISLVYFWLVITKDHSNWVERCLDLKDFVIWFCFGCVLVLLSGLMDGFVTRVFGPEFKDHVAKISESKATTIAWAGAAFLATCASLFWNGRKY